MRLGAGAELTRIKFFRGVIGPAMSYTVLARKWRPRRFKELVGQKHVVTPLVNALATERLHHAYLFSGTRGVGKTTLARILAKALNCVNGVVAEPCGECDACIAIDEGRFLDLIEVDAASQTGVDHMRELLENVQYTPSQGRFKVYLIDEVHMLSKSSFNALLKTLEEPPPHIKFLLATTDPKKLPVTVLSRCLQFNLKRLTLGEIHAQLKKLCAEEGVVTESTGLSAIAKAADGSMRDALSLLDQAIGYGKGEVSQVCVAAMLGSIDQGHVIRLIEGLSAGDGSALMNEVAQLDEQAPDYGAVLDELVSSLQRIAVIQVVGEDDAIDGYEELSRLAPTLSAEDVQLYYQIALQGRRDLDACRDFRSAFEMTLLRMFAFRPVSVEKSTVGPTDRSVRAKAKTTPKADPATAPADPTGSESARGRRDEESAAEVDPEEWSRLLGESDVRGAPRQLAEHCALGRRNGGRFELILGPENSHLKPIRFGAVTGRIERTVGGV
ncbi:MAG: hypothetical protein CM1200mP36_10630 [Gammaproteobacteria bacterium]|nr:MAG: hypothetical protein CM1200mP36_10630 [Gammaproteobacteria bacterium]